MPTRPPATCISPCAPSPTTGSCPGSGSTKWCRARPRPAGSGIPPTSPCGRRRSPASRRGRRRGVPAGPAGTSNARRWPAPTSGAEFDIHGGGLDLIFPHHENEAAQSHGVGDGFARYWMHSHWVTMAGEKMSKSLGNILSVPAITAHTRPIALRYYLISVHYRSSIEYSPEALEDAAKAFERIESFLHRAADRRSATRSTIVDVPDAFRQAMDDDLGVPRALAVVHERVRAGNAALSAGERRRGPAETAAAVRAMLAVLGLDPWAEPWAVERPDRRLVEATGHADRGAAAGAGRRRGPRGTSPGRTRSGSGSAEAGFAIEDTKDGPVWSVAGRPRRTAEHCTGLAEAALQQFTVGGRMAGNSQRRGRDAQGGHQEGRDRRIGRAVPARRCRARARPRRPRRAPAIPRPAGRPRPPGRDEPAASGSGRRPARPLARARRCPRRWSAAIPVVEALRAGVPATALYVAAGLASRRAGHRGRRRRRRAGHRRCWRWRGRSWTGSPATPCTRASPWWCRPTSTRTRRTCSAGPRTRAGPR